MNILGDTPAPRTPLLACCLRGYIGKHIYRLWGPTRQKLVVSRDDVFKEDEFLPLSDFGTISN
jgi:hypothetical protein